MLQYQTLNQTFTNDFSINTDEQRLQQCLKIGNALIALSLFFMAICIAVSFIFDQNFSLTSQVAAHVGTIVFAAIVKIGYVVRCIGAHGLGHSSY